MAKTISLLSILASVGALLVFSAGCSPDPKPGSKGTSPATSAQSADGHDSRIITHPGIAGGVREETFTATAVVTAVDRANRKITLQDSEGHQGTFTAPAEMRNFNQINAGDRVSATFLQRLTVAVSAAGDAAPGTDYTATAGRAPAGAKPGVIVAENFEVVGTVKSIDAAKREATVEFPGGKAKTVPIRDDVDLARYHAGDSLIIRVNEKLTLLVESAAP